MNHTKVKEGNSVKDYLHRDNGFPVLRLPSVQNSAAHIGEVKKVKLYTRPDTEASWDIPGTAMKMERL